MLNTRGLAFMENGVSSSERNRLVTDVLHFAATAPLGRPLVVVHDSGQIHQHNRHFLRELAGVRLASLTNEGLEGELAAGRTVTVNSVDMFLSSVATVAHELSDGRPVSCNAFVSASGSVSPFGWHRDDADAVVLQLAGSKQWQFRDSEGKTTLLMGATSDPLYMMRHVEHRTESVSGISVHLTFAMR